VISIPTLVNCDVMCGFPALMRFGTALIDVWEMSTPHVPIIDTRVFVFLYTFYTASEHRDI
jgi:hypothetical protein